MYILDFSTQSLAMIMGDEDGKIVKDKVVGDSSQTVSIFFFRVTSHRTHSGYASKSYTQDMCKFQARTNPRLGHEILFLQPPYPLCSDPLHLIWLSQGFLIVEMCSSRESSKCVIIHIFTQSMFRTLMWLVLTHPWHWPDMAGFKSSRPKHYPKLERGEK